ILASFSSAIDPSLELPLALRPGVASLAVWSPGLNANGNSKLGSIALEKLARMMNWSIFAP
ncbi:hypothetical protein EN902_35555, partial [Mesorhizobium sp. M7A.F.Ca.CA.001.16.1.1]|uniref:glutaminase n=1 Tax=Mesorhizobium sp. M7A.F.Ca.CA.001.16.1.1 TaxID=2496683 RepID=UPI000FD4B19B